MIWASRLGGSAKTLHLEKWGHKVDAGRGSLRWDVRRGAAARTGVLFVRVELSERMTRPCKRGTGLRIAIADEERINMRYIKHLDSTVLRWQTETRGDEV